MNADSQSVLYQLGGFDVGQRQHLFRFEAVGGIQIDGNDVGDGQQLVQSLQRVVRDYFSMIDDDDAVAESLRLFHVVGGVDESLAAFFQYLKIVKNGVAALGIDPNRWFIQQQNLRIMEQRRGQVQ